MAARVLVFVHVPKTAGATLHRVIERQHRQGRVETVRMLDRDVDDFPDLVPGAGDADLAVVKGHVPFGVHRHLARPPAYVTMLRDPVDRVRSLYQFARTEPRHPLHEEIRRRDLTLRAFVTSGVDRDQTDDGQVRQVVGAPGRRLDEDDLDVAFARLEHDFAAVGVQEEFDASLLLWRRALGWRRVPVYVARNRSAGAPTRVTDEDRRVIEAHNRLDRRLHAFAADLVARRRAEAAGFEVELALFRAANRVAGAVARAVGR